MSVAGVHTGANPFLKPDIQYAMKPKLSISSFMCCFGIALLFILPNFVTAQTIYTFAGGKAGDGRPALESSIGEVRIVKADTLDNVFIYDWQTRTIRRVDAASSMMKTIAGGGMINFGDTVAALDYDLGSINDFTVHASGTIYIAELNGIRKLDTLTGKLILVAGRNFGYSGDNGPAIDAGFDHVTSIATDNAGNIYVTDDNRIRKIDILTGIITRIAGSGSVGFSGNNGLAINAELGQPKYIGIDSANNLFIGDQSGSMIRKITASTGIISAFAGTGMTGYSGDGGQAKLAKIDLRGITVDSSLDIYIADESRIRKIDKTTSVITTVAGTGNLTGPANDDGPATAANILGILGIGISAKGKIYISDLGHFAVRQFNIANGVIKRHIGNGFVGVAGIGGLAADAQLLNTGQIVIDRKNNMYISDESNARIFRIDGVTKIISVYAGTGIHGVPYHGDGGPAIAANIGAPARMAIDTAGNLYFDDNHQFIKKIEALTGKITTIAGTPSNISAGDNGPATAASFANIGGIAIDAMNNIYVSDQYVHKIRKVDSSGTITTIAGTGSNGFSGDGGPATAAALFFPSALAFDKQGNLYIADFTNFRIRKIEKLTGKITTVAGNGLQAYAGDNGPATAASITYITGLAIDNANNIFISDNLSHRIRKITSQTGNISAYAGNGAPGYNGDSIPAITAMINTPADIAIDTSGRIYFGDYENRRVRMIQPLSDSAKPVLKGIVYYDNNLNGVKDAGEPLANDIVVSAKKSGLEIRVPTKAGKFEIKADTGAYITTVLDQPYYNIVPASVNSTLANFISKDSISFALQPIAGKKDLTVTIRSVGPVRQGTQLAYDIEYANIGTTDASDVRLRFIKSFKTKLDSSAPIRTSLVGDTLIWNLNTLAAQAKGKIRVYTKVGILPLAGVNDSLFTSAIISHSVADLTPASDTSRLKQRVSGAFDPTNKQESHAGAISPQQVANGEYLNYLVRFQNTGNDTAIHVEIRDTLDLNLDAATVQTISSSHPYQLSIADGNKLSWKFDSILLPDSNATKNGSVGYLAFRVKVKTTLVPGDEIKNSSTIYFDYNTSVITNKTVTVVKNLRAPSTRPVLNLSSILYCILSGDQKLKITNKPTTYTAKVYLNDSLLNIAADTSFIIKPQLLTSGDHNLRVHFVNETGENTLITVIKINPAVVPETDLLTDKNAVTSESESFILTGVNKKDGGTIPLYTFARDRSFSSILKAESTSATATITASLLANGDNWLYLRMRTSESCFTNSTAIDSVKVTKTITTGIVDLDNPSLTVNAYPNPFERGFTISGLNSSKTYLVLVRDSKGVLTATYSIANKATFYIAGDAWLKGIYWITMIDVKRSRTMGSMGVIKQ